MCDPGTVLAAATLAIGTGSAIAGHVAQDKAAKANKQNALAALTGTWKDLSLQEVQQQDATGLTIMQADRQARTADAQARVSAGEAGVSGASVDAVLGDISAQGSAFKQVQKKNLDMTIAQIERQKVAASVDAQNRINSVRPANPFATGLTIAGLGVDFGNTLISRKPNTKKAAA